MKIHSYNMSEQTANLAANTQTLYFLMGFLETIQKKDVALIKNGHQGSIAVVAKILLDLWKRMEKQPSDQNSVKTFLMSSWAQLLISGHPE